MIKKLLGFFKLKKTEKAREAQMKRRKNERYLKKIARLEPEEVLKTLKTNLNGLTEDEVEQRQDQYGENRIGDPRGIWVKKLLYTVFNPFILILAVLVVYSFVRYGLGGASDNLITGIIVSVMILISLALTLFQDVRSWKATKKLRQMVQTTTAVIREPELERFNPVNLNNLSTAANAAAELPIATLVPGDIIFLSSGDMVPADVRLIASTDLFVNEATLTGESSAVEKHAQGLGAIANKQRAITCNNLCFMGSSVISGSAIAVVVATGKKTYFGAIAVALSKTRLRSNFDRGIRKVTYVLIGLMAIVAPLLFIIKSASQNWVTAEVIDALIWALAAAVALTPEMLPMVVTGNLAKGALRMSRNKVIVKSLNVMQGLGEMNVLCTDKTGTLTEDQIDLIKHLDLSGKESSFVLEYAYLNSYYQTGLKNNIDKTIIQHIKAHHDQIINKDYVKVDEIPFDFSRRRMSVAMSSSTNSAETVLITKGAVEEILKISSKALINGKVVPITKAIERNVLNLSRKLNREGLRAIALCYRPFSATKTVFGVDDESEMILLGYLGFLDVPKKSAVKAISSLRKHGIGVKILTGDNEIVTRAICKRVGLDPGEPILGDQMAKMTDSQLRLMVPRTTIFAKLNPLQKARIIEILQSTNQTVGFMGDGINDAVALKTADVGISVDAAADISKEASDLILLEKSLTVLEEGVIVGRKTFVNIIKYIKTTFSSNFGNALSLLIAVIWFPLFQPMLALQILVQNLIYDLSQLATPWDKIDPELIQLPRKWETRSFIPFALVNGTASSVFDVLTFALMGFYFGVFANPTSDAQALFHTGWFTVGLTTQIAIFHLTRTNKLAIIQSRASWPVYTLGAILMAIGMALPYTKLGHSIGLVALPGIYYAFWAAIIGGYFALSQGVKIVYQKVYRSWL